jgi:hypothetical protein
VATPATRSFHFTDAGGIPVSVQVTSAGGRRPVVVLAVPSARSDLTGRLARAGFAVVSFEQPDALEDVLDAVARGVVGLEANSYALVEPRSDGSMAVSRWAGGVSGPAVVVPGLDGLVQWLATHHV